MYLPKHDGLLRMLFLFNRMNFRSKIYTKKNPDRITTHTALVATLRGDHPEIGWQVDMTFLVAPAPFAIHPITKKTSFLDEVIWSDHVDRTIIQLFRVGKWPTPPSTLLPALTAAALVQVNRHHLTFKISRGLLKKLLWFKLRRRYVLKGPKFKVTKK